MQFFFFCGEGEEINKQSLARFVLGSGPADFSYTMTLVLTHRNQDSYSFRISVGKCTSLHEIFAMLMCTYFAKLLHFESL